jgi:hypothetical protein
LGSTLNCTLVVFVDIPSAQDVLAANFPHGMEERFLVVIITHVVCALKREVEILAGTDAREVVGCAI